MVVGAQKAGTTWLFECLNEHPEIFVAPQKETHYFCTPEGCRVSRRDQGLDWYLGLFPEAGYKAVGELSTDYMLFESVPAELAAFEPTLKIVFMLREPIDRAYSAYWMERKYRASLPPFEQALERRPDYVERGLYHRQIERFRRHFPDRQIRIYIYEEASADPDAFLADLFGFLEVDGAFRPASAGRRIAGSTDVGPLAGFLIYKVLSPAINLPGLRAAWRLLRRRTRLYERIVALIGRRRESDAGYPPLSPQVRRQLGARFEADKERLFALLGREIPAWQAPGAASPRTPAADPPAAPR